MQVLEEKETNQFEFTYKIEPGISRIEGAIKILEEMEYPEDILNMIRCSK
jgi:DNA mismatch repair ATPase MutS